MTNLRLTALLIAILLAGTGLAHPGGAIAVSAKGVVYFVDTGAGVFSIDAGGRIVRREGPAFHWFAFDPGSRFIKTPWPSIPNGELRSAGVDPTIILSSDVPVTIGTDGRFYYPDNTSGDRVRIVGVEPSGAKSVRATLPLIPSAGKNVRWVNGLAAGPDGSLYYTEDRVVRRIDARGKVSTVANVATVANCPAIPGNEAYLGPYLRGLAVTGDGTVYVTASGCGVVLRVDPKGRVSEVLRAAPPWSPTAVAVAAGDVYVLEYLHTASDNRREWLPRVRKLSASGKVSTLGGNTR